MKPATAERLRFCYNTVGVLEVGSLRRWLFGMVFLLAMGLGQVAMAASASTPYASPGVIAILVGVLTIAVFLWIYSFIA